jgi:hypothetical protein
MSNFQFQKATKQQSRLRLALIGPSGAGKTYSALRIGTTLGKTALIDTERGSASKYAGDPFEFDTLSLESFEPRTYVDAIKAAEEAGYEVLVIDSLSHAWSGKGGALEQVDRRASANKFAAWREVTPMHNELVDAILGARMHVIATMRSKTEYAVEQDGGKTKVVKLGLAPVQRDGMEYEFDVVGDIDQRHILRVTKTRCRQLDDAVIPNPGEDVAETLRAWLTDGTEPANRDKLDAVLARGKKVAPNLKWEDKAQQALGHPFATATQVELDNLADRIGEYVTTLEAEKNGKAQEELTTA